MLKKSDFYYDLPEDLIAQHPLDRRDHSRLMVLSRASGDLHHHHFYDLIQFVRPGDCLILNDSRVLPARMFGRKTPPVGCADFPLSEGDIFASLREGGGTQCRREATDDKINEFLLLTQREQNVWECITKPGKRAKTGSIFIFGDGKMTGEVIEVLPDGNRIVKFNPNGEFFAVLDEIGQMPLPPYITEKLDDNERYQTVYSKETGSAAAPTAGLHFTMEMLETLKNHGINIGYVTLHVGLGTFRPVKAKNVLDHHMHSEHYVLPLETAELINRTKAEGGRVICVGTTSCRTLESCAQNGFPLTAQDGWTDIFIYPGYEFRVMDSIITNFHLPESTLIMLVSAFAGRERVLDAYKQAVEERYRFFSFGDAMMII